MSVCKRECNKGDRVSFVLVRFGGCRRRRNGEIRGISGTSESEVRLHKAK